MLNKKELVISGTKKINFHKSSQFLIILDPTNFKEKFDFNYKNDLELLSDYDSIQKIIRISDQ
jgi:hypothetical protein